MVKHWFSTFKGPGWLAEISAVCSFHPALIAHQLDFMVSTYDRNKLFTFFAQEPLFVLSVWARAPVDVESQSEKLLVSKASYIYVYVYDIYIYIYIYTYIYYIYVAVSGNPWPKVVLKLSDQYARVSEGSWGKSTSTPGINFRQAITITSLLKNRCKPTTPY